MSRWTSAKRFGCATIARCAGLWPLCGSRWAWARASSCSWSAWEDPSGSVGGTAGERRHSVVARECPDAVPGIGPHPMAWREHRASVLLLKLRVAGLVSRHRTGLPTGGGTSSRGPGDAVALTGRAARADRFRERLSGDGRPEEQPTDLLHHRHGDDWATDLAHVAGGVPCRRGGDVRAG